MTEAVPPTSSTELVKISDANIVRESTIHVLRTVKLNGGDQDSASEQETIAVTRFATAPAVASVSIPIKISRNFQSIGLEIGVQLPCYKEELPQAIELAYRLAKERIAKEIPAIQEALNGVMNPDSPDAPS